MPLKDPGIVGTLTMRNGGSIKTEAGAVILEVDSSGNASVNVDVEFDASEGINDSNGNELLGFGITASAVNYAKVSNAATGNPVVIAAEGDDNSAGISVVGKAGGAATAAGGAAAVIGGAGNTSGAGGASAVTGGAGGATGNGGAAGLLGGAGGSTSGNGGAVAITGGTPVEGAGGAVSISGAAGVGTNQNGGSVAIVAGASTGTGTPGSITLTAGDGTSLSGAGGITLTAGAALNGTDGDGGIVNIVGGISDGTGDGGSVVLTGGDSENGTTGTVGGSGGISLTVGVPGTATTGTAGAGGSIDLNGAFGGSTTGVGGTGGAGSSINLTAGNGGDDTDGTAGTGGAGGVIALNSGTGGLGNTEGVAGMVLTNGMDVFAIGAPAAKTSSTTLTAAEVIARHITANEGSSGTANYQFPTGADLAAALPATFAVGNAFIFYVTNISTDAAEDVTLTTNTNITLVGNMTVASNAVATDQSAGQFLVRMTAANTFSVTRVG